ncbi:hypothetical protein GCM10022200_04130 [Microbacterium awajiense]|uniref:Dioxygenase n=1 Tax=Microbacterium awajiense TaxID=415214 RepID=A0ABP7A4V8_9MICO
MATGGKDRTAREARERARVYEARREFHESQQRRRVRDNWIAGIAGGALIVALFGSQYVYFTMGPGAPSPAPTSTSTPTPVETTTPTPEPTPTDTGSPTPTPTS